ncbi:hypothetical protein L484_019948 [Morus notabilis]|uniref:Uncharacterized protein n=1 Tax=Morus notabilis TaxID=981085 RepID=W9RJL4_9ROSA|nr:hypothetical protein L484_019948 [Morus notabilis]
MRPNWELKKCCNHEQVAFLITVSVCTVVILALWRTILLRPFKLVTVFLHEASHAIACKLTCGKVEGIQVHADEGGTTQTRGGVYWLILPAGYLGSSFWGMLLILASTNLLTARIAAGCFLAALVIVLFVAKNWTLRGLCIDIYDDLISRRVHSSDAEKFAEVCPCPCNGVGWGVIWWNGPIIMAARMKPFFPFFGNTSPSPHLCQKFLCLSSSLSLLLSLAADSQRRRLRFQLPLPSIVVVAAADCRRRRLVANKPKISPLTINASSFSTTMLFHNTLAMSLDSKPTELERAKKNQTLEGRLVFR